MSGNSGFSRRQTVPIVSRRWRAGAVGCHQGWRKVSRYLPIWTSSPSSSSADSTRLRLTKVPFRLPPSSIVQRPPRLMSTACLRETVTSSRKMPQSGERPIVVAVALRRERLAGAAAAGADDERRRLDRHADLAELLEQLLALLGREGLRRLAALLGMRGARRTSSSSSRPPGSGSRTRGSRCGSSGRRGVAFPARISVSDVDVDLVEDALAPGLLEARDELGAQDVDLPVQQAPLVRDLLLLLRVLVDQAFQILVGQRSKIRERFHAAAFRSEGQVEL